MPVEIILPKVDMDMATGRISRWFVGEGAVVKKGDLLFEIETDKAAMEIDAPAGGILRDISGREGIDIPVGKVVAWIYSEWEERGKLDATQEWAVESPSSPAGPSPRQNGEKEDGFNADAPLSPSLRGEGKGEGQIGGATRASPLARRLAREFDVDIAAVAGSGPHGRVVKADVEAAIAGASFEAPALRASAPQDEGGQRGGPRCEVRAERASKDDSATLKLFAEGSYELVPHDTMRKTIARRLVEAKTTIPHFYLTVDCELDALLALRSQLNAASPMKKTEKGEVPAYKLSVNDMVIKAMALALRDVPTANVSWTETAMVQHKAVDVGVAVSIPGGLITPIIRQADTKTLSVISGEMKDLAARARNKKLKPEEYQGGTTAVSNLGMFGVKDFSAVINPPHATILAVGAGEERAVVKKGEIKVATIMSVTLSTDHRAVDGALGAELMVAFKRHIENPLGMLV